MRTSLILAICLLSLSGLQARSHNTAESPTVFIPPADGFEVNIAAACQRKHVPVQIVTSESAAEYILRPAPVVIHKESGAGKIARCLFAYCAGIADSGDVSVQLIQKQSQSIVWAYEVSKQTGARNRQSMAEAIAKHLRQEFFR